MTTPRDDRRPDRRPDWLRRKHGHAQPKPRTRIDRWADYVVQMLEGVQAGQHTSPWPDRASADEARKALNRAARRAGVSIGAYLADPDTGRCVNCDRMRCGPSATGHFVLHVNTFTKKDAYAYMLDRYGPDTSTWPYIPGGRPPARPGNPAANPEPAARKVPAACPHCHRRWRVPHRWQRFTCPTCNGTVEFRRTPVGPPFRPRGKTLLQCQKAATTAAGAGRAGRSSRPGTRCSPRCTRR
jgi:hypothetical protein